jgi:hypothetical protein
MSPQKQRSEANWMHRPKFTFSYQITHLMSSVSAKCNLIFVPITYLLTYSMVQNMLWKSDSHSDCQRIACFLYETRRFITVFTKSRHRTLSWGSRIQFAPSIPVSLRSILMLSSHLRLGLLSGLLLRASQPKPCKHLSLIPCVLHVSLTSSSLI